MSIKPTPKRALLEEELKRVQKALDDADQRGAPYVELLRLIRKELLLLERLNGIVEGVTATDDAEKLAATRLLGESE
jgi:DNA polymerase III delta subunit